ncbi:NAD(P)H-dependent oxidoreductase [Cardiobacteriaceae bacterium TAE3-ERU3]|nr:NAD(P)H-dependent oxidoreductase [Cardiobacteriaceae bacterium TAE3-ERU3]
MTVLAFAASNSSTSINHQLVSYAASLCGDTKVIKLTDYDIPLYDPDHENEHGIPGEVQRLHDEIAAADALIISLAEHNGSPSAFFKSQIDWLSRHNRPFLQGKKIILLATSPGAGGAQSALSITEKMLPFFDGEVVATVSVPKFYEVFQDDKLIDNDLDQQLKAALAKLS